MKIVLNKIEADLIKNWFGYEYNGHFGDGAFSIGEEASIIQKLKINENKEKVICDFNLTELEILKNWSEHNHGIYEEINLMEKIKKAYEIEKRNFSREIHKKY